jgi:hypothetical protein
MMQTSLTVTTERLHAFEEKINSKLDALTAVKCSLILSGKKRTPESFCVQLLQTQNQLSQSLQEQFSRVQTQQSRILELLAPLHPILESVPLHINIARNAILEKIPEGCQCRCTDDYSGASVVPPFPTPPESAEPPVGARKRRRVSLDTTCLPDPNNPPFRRCQDQPVAIQVRRTPNGCAQRPGETPTSAQPHRDGVLLAVQTPSGEKSGNEALSRGHQKGAQPQSGNASLAARLSVISRGIAPRVSLWLSYTWLYESPLIHTAQVTTAAVPGKRFILFDDNDDDDDDEL